MKKLITVIGLVLVICLLVLSCAPPPPTVTPTPSPTPIPRPVPAPTPTPAASEADTPTAQDDIIKIEMVMREYFAAFSDYDVDRVGALIAEETLNSEGMEILEAVLFAKGINLKMELTAIDIQIDGDTAIAITTLKTSLGSGDDTYKLVREDGNWKIHSKIPSSS